MGVLLLSEHQIARIVSHFPLAHLVPCVDACHQARLAVAKKSSP